MTLFPVKLITNKLKHKIGFCHNVCNEAWGHSNLMTSRSLARLGEIGGPRCCKRNSYLSILTAVDYIEEVTGIKCRNLRSSADMCHQTASVSEIDVRSPVKGIELSVEQMSDCLYRMV